MRSSKPRPRSKNNRNNNRSSANVLNRVFDSSGPEGKVRGTPQQVIEKYQQLTRDAQLSGDRVGAENFQQHAEHYMRLQADAQREIDLRREQQDRESRESREKQAQRDQEQGERTGRVENDKPIVDGPGTADFGTVEQKESAQIVDSVSTLGLGQNVENINAEKGPSQKTHRQGSAKASIEEAPSTELLSSREAINTEK
jgi:sRNA-binding protein